uniref:alpha/beta hydrolase family protein n=1 Tax=Agathobacter sp. TaxID=2021311 RepID=UPI003FEF0957
MKPQYVVTTDITYAQVDSWFGHCRRDLKLDLIYPEDGEGKTHPQEAYENSPVSKVTPDAPPFLLIHGTKDSTVPFSQSEELYDALEAAGCDVTLLALDGAEHADLMFFQDEVWQQIIAFFKRTL